MKMIRRFNVVVATALLLILSGLHSVYAEPTYTISDLGVSGRTVIAVALNNQSDVAISTGREIFTDQVLEGQAFVQRNGISVEIAPADGDDTVLYGLNDPGFAVGSIYRQGYYDDAILIKDGQIIPVNPPNAESAIAYSINDAGYVVGQSKSRGFLRSPDGAFQDLGTLGGASSTAFDINSAGVVVGTSETVDNVSRAFAWIANGLQNLGTLGGRGSGAQAVNDSNQIVGYASTTRGRTHAALFSIGGPAIDLDPDGIQSLAYGINNAGVIVGKIELDSGMVRAAIFTPNHAPTLLEDLIPSDAGWECLFQAQQVNDLGQIVGMGLIDGRVHGFLATPIPEPSALTLISIAALGVFGSLHRSPIRS